jgi:hypothetical protein
VLEIKISFCPSSMLSSVPHIVPTCWEAIEVPYCHIGQDRLLDDEDVSKFCFCKNN